MTTSTGSPPSRSPVTESSSSLLPFLPAPITEQEMPCGRANARIIGFADRHGFTHQSQTVILCFGREQLANLPLVQLPALPPTQRDALGALHDRAFPNTHAPSAALLARNEAARGRGVGAQLLTGALHESFADPRVHLYGSGDQ